MHMHGILLGLRNVQCVSYVLIVYIGIPYLHVHDWCLAYHCVTIICVCRLCSEV